MTTAIVINLDRLKELMLDYLAERGYDEADDLRRLTLSDFVLWLRHKQEVTSGHQALLGKSLRPVRPIDG